MKLEKEVICNKKVSVVIPVYNCREYVCEAIDSVLGQTYPIHEVIVVDDGSTDNLQQVLSPYLEKIIFKRQENKGAASARNAGVKISTGDWIAFLDSDDIWLPDKISRQMALADLYPEVDLIYGQVQNFDEQKSREVWPTQVSEIPNHKYMLQHWATLNHTPPTPTVVLKRIVLLGLVDFIVIIQRLRI